MPQTTASSPLILELSGSTAKKPDVAQSPGRIALRRFFRHRMAVLGLILLCAILLFTIGGAFFYPEAYANHLSLSEKLPHPALHILSGRTASGGTSSPA